MSIGPRVVIGKGVRIKDAIILDNVTIGVMYKIRIFIHTVMLITF